VDRNHGTTLSGDHRLGTLPSSPLTGSMLTQRSKAAQKNLKMAAISFNYVSTALLIIS
jgi:hypothetical protein